MKTLLLWNAVPESVTAYILEPGSQLAELAKQSAGKYINSDAVEEGDPIDQLNDQLEAMEGIESESVLTGPFDCVIVCGVFMYPTARGLNGPCTREETIMISCGNHPKTDRNFVMGAIEASGAPVEWRDEPDSMMDHYTERSKFGSVWAPEHVDLSEFWKEFRLRKETSC